MSGRSGSRRRLPVVAIVGAPNVGKSSLVNRILGRRQAVVADEPGTTRDRTYNTAEWAGHHFELVDTGGMEPLARSGLEALVTLQARAAAEEAEVIVHLADGQTGSTGADLAIARELRRLARGVPQGVPRGAPGGGAAKVVLAVNKLDNPDDDTERHAFYTLGEGEPLPISALHGLGIGDLLDEIVARLPEAGAGTEDSPPRLAIVGRPNSGKSTLLNRLLGSERAVVSETPGTTTDAVAGELWLDAPSQRPERPETENGPGGGGRYVLLDTAGVNRGARRAAGVPYYSLLKTEQAIRDSDVSLLLVDAVDGLVGGDLQLARTIEKAGRACGVIVNKRDLVTGERLREIQRELSARMTDLRPPAVAVSALTGAGAGRILPLAERLYRAYTRRVPTHEMAELINELVARSAPARGVKIRFATQTGSAPPRFTLFANRPRDVQPNYLRYVENALRERYDLYGVSLRLRVKSSRPGR